MSHIGQIIVFSILLTCEPMIAQDVQPSKANMAPDRGPEGEASTARLQKATQNPVANLISVPLQNNSNFSVGPYDRTQDVLNV